MSFLNFLTGTLGYTAILAGSARHKTCLEAQP